MCMCCNKGIHEKIDYLKDELHVDAVCIGPMNPTPNITYGYNIMDYNHIFADHYGSMEDFEKLRVALHKKGIYFFYRAMHFSAKRGIAIVCCPSVCLSVCDVQVS